jgi:hypothetical protein
MKRKTAFLPVLSVVLFMTLALGCEALKTPPRPITDALTLPSDQGRPAEQTKGPVCTVTKIDENLFSIQALKAEHLNGFSSGFGSALDAGLNELKKEYIITSITPVTYYVGHGSATMKLYVFVTPKDISRLFPK